MLVRLNDYLRESVIKLNDPRNRFRKTEMALGYMLSHRLAYYQPLWIKYAARYKVHPRSIPEVLMRRGRGNGSMLSLCCHYTVLSQEKTPSTAVGKCLKTIQRPSEPTYLAVS